MFKYTADRFCDTLAIMVHFKARKLFFVTAIIIDYDHKTKKIKWTLCFVCLDKVWDVRL